MRNPPFIAAILFGALPLLGATTTASAANVDAGRAAYANNCAGCHNVPVSPWNVSTQSLQNAIQSNRGGMGRLSILSAADLQDITTYLANPSATVAATNTPSTPVPVSTDNDSDRIFDWAESTNPQLFNTHSISEKLEGYYLRYYPGTGVYLASQNGQLYFYNTHNPKEGVLSLGPLSGWLKQLTPTFPARPDDDDNGHEDGDNHNNDHQDRD